MDLQELAEYGALVFAFGCLTVMVYLLANLIRHVMDRASEIADKFNTTDENTNRVLERLTARIEAQEEMSRARLDQAQSQAEALREILQELRRGHSERDQIINEAVSRVNVVVTDANTEQTEVLRGIIESAIERYIAEFDRRVKAIERMPEQWKAMLRAATEETRVEFSRGLDRVIEQFKQHLSEASKQEQKNDRNPSERPQ